MIPFSLMKTEAGRKAGDESTSVATKIGDALNRKYHEIWMMYPWVESIVINKSFTLTSGRVDQVLPNDVDIVYSVTERTNNEQIVPVSAYVYDMKYLQDVATSNAPLAYTPAGKAALGNKMSADSKLTFISDSASDTTQTIRIYSKNSSGVYISEQITLTGTTSVTTSATFLAGWIENVQKSALTVGTVTVTDASANTIGTIAPRDYTNKYIRINLQAPPDQSYTAYVSGKKPFKRLEYAEDIPAFECCDALVHYATAEVLRLRDKYQQAEYETKEGDRILTALVTNKEIMSEDRDDTIPTVFTSETDRPILIG